MSPSRRDVLRLGAALGFGASMPTSAERIHAMSVLNQPIAEGVLNDPGSFAIDTDRRIGSANFEWWEAMAPAEHQERTNAEETLQRLIPALNDKHGAPDVWVAWGNLEAAVESEVLEAYEAGLRQGAHYEHLRMSAMKGAPE